MEGFSILDLGSTGWGYGIGIRRPVLRFRVLLSGVEGLVSHFKL